MRRPFWSISTSSTSRDWDAIGPAMEAGLRSAPGALPTDRSAHPRRGGPDGAAAAARPRHRSADAAGQLIITPACGLAAFTRDAAIRALRTLRTAAGIVTEQLAD